MDQGMMIRFFHPGGGLVVSALISIHHNPVVFDSERDGLWFTEHFQNGFRYPA